MDKSLINTKTALSLSAPIHYISVIVGLILFFIFSNPLVLIYSYIIGLVLLFVSFIFWSYILLQIEREENNSK